MTIDSAIQHLKESLADPTHKWGCEECKAEHIQLLVWLESYKDISESYPEVCKKMDRLEEENMRLFGSALRIGKMCEVFESENRELKRLLMLAVEDLDTAMTGNKHIVCKNLNPETDDCDYDDICAWRYQDEAMKLLGGNENDND